MAKLEVEVSVKYTGWYWLLRACLFLRINPTVLLHGKTLVYFKLGKKRSGSVTFNEMVDATSI